MSTEARDLPPPRTVLTEWPAADGLNRRYLTDEAGLVRELLARYDLGPDARASIEREARSLVAAVRSERRYKGGIDAFMREYDLSSEEGIVLMCLAEALLRIPDADTADKLIADKLAAGQWDRHLGTSESAFVNASTWGLMLTGRLVRPAAETVRHPTRLLRDLATRVGEPVVRTAMRQAMRIMGHQYVMGRTIGEALERAGERGARRYRYSFDMLGEAALTAEDAERYFEAYADAIRRLGESAAAGERGGAGAPGISVKLSALHPRYEFLQQARAIPALVERLRSLAFLARDAGIPLTVDAEEADRLELSLRIFERVHGDDALGDWPGIGLAVQAYQKRAPDVIDWLIGLAAARGRVINVRLVKGAYWDTEIKRAQEQGLEGYPVYTRKINTDLAYLVCARRLLEAEAPVYPQFATHNAHTVASVLHLGRGRDWEFQRLHGMGEELYDALAASGCDVPCRVYAPVGRHKDLLPYLVRRLLENGANTSFVNRIVDEDAPVDDLVADPVERIRRADGLVHPRIPLPPALYGAERPNSRGPNLADAAVVNELGAAMEAGLAKPRTVVPRLAVDAGSRGETRSSVNPARRDEVVGRVVVADDDTVDRAVRSAVDAFESWNGVPVERRAAILRAAADLYEAHRGELMALAVHEAGKTLRDAVAEVREAVDFLRYYAAEALGELARPRPMPGPTGERNELRYTGRGPFVCISPWNFPLAIFTGQVAAALVAGNPVLAKPAEQTPLIAGLAVELLHRAGVPRHALQFLPGDGETVGAALVAAPGIAGVAFTGGTETAWAIQRALAAKRGPIPAFIAETGGQNAMIVDSSALPEQVVLDVFQSAFQSAGQRCSALRVLLVQSDVADRVLTLLAGYMETLAIGDPALPETDVGPVIDEAARDALETYVDGASLHGRVIHRCRLGAGTRAGTFVAPVAVEVDGLNRLGPEVFGPVLHVVRYDAGDLDAVIDGINGLEYGLTLGIQSRIDTVAAHILSRVRVGNAYVNRNMVGAVVGVQPFGGRGLSGTGPKAGGPHYLHRFVNEMTVTTNTAAVGGNAALLSLEGS